MFRVAICDDEATALQLNTMLTEKLLKEEGISYELRSFDDIQDMADTLMRPGQPYDLLITDILASGINGIEAAEKLRSIGEKLDIIFISSTAEYALEGYRVQALRYLKKPVDIEQLREALLISYRKTAQKEGLSLTCEGKLYNIRYEEIVYAESQARDVELTLKDRRLVTHMKISDLEKLLPDQFFRCHRSYIVNLLEVETIERYQATMKNEDYIPISQQLYTEMKNRMFQSQTQR
ncbi:MAG: LytTR family DNA-binding domain-containing protein [Lachnospiraceae bacterium]|nr:LytTR family DNA-binding domain-containing protein [Lachnospiraceae bacterium]